MAGDSPAAEPCPGCEFSFHTTMTGLDGCSGWDGEAMVGFDVDAELAYLDWYAYYELGPFPATLVPGPVYDRLEFAGTSTWYFYTVGYFRLY